MEGSAFPERGMKPTPEQIAEALRNYYRPLRTPGVKVRDALEHVSNTEKEKPGAATNSDRAGGDLSNERQAQNST